MCAATAKLKKDWDALLTYRSVRSTPTGGFALDDEPSDPSTTPTQVGEHASDRRRRALNVG